MAGTETGPLAHVLPRPTVAMEKPAWVDALEESLLLAIVLFSLITWIVMIGLFAH
ncbi:MAG: hypothetical protein JO020_05370 [Chloroflexi bacterium]|nr:hypothetical protein [Chloroflexota bacterium]MBV9131250.1 hypothetical protein [Chloroflexota bacterium]MBV9893580.1 hypothetical protein [Chloroflexota bacterium]